MTLSLRQVWKSVIYLWIRGVRLTGTPHPFLLGYGGLGSPLQELAALSLDTLVLGTKLEARKGKLQKSIPKALKSRGDEAHVLWIHPVQMLLTLFEATDPIPPPSGHSASVREPRPGVRS